MFHNLARKAIAVARPVRISGVDFTRVSVIARSLPTLPFARAAKADAGSAPEAANSRAMIQAVAEGLVRRSSRQLSCVGKVTRPRSERPPSSGLAVRYR